jgi:hypothetical protein
VVLVVWYGAPEVIKEVIMVYKMRKGSFAIEAEHLFVEAHVREPKRVLTKALLVFGELSVSIEGVVSGAQLLAILQTLEASC